MKCLIRTLAYTIIMLFQKIKHRNVIFEFGSKSPLSSTFEGNNKLAHHAYFSGEMGFASYVGANSVVIGKIGRFCSIAEKVTFLTKTHPVQGFVSSHPAFYSMKKQSGFSFAEQQLFDEDPTLKGGKYSIEVGNDVYIGYGATVIGPCRIGDGAVIAAGAVVTRDVSPYAIVGGVPASLIKFRFNEEDIRFLSDLQWWNKPQEWLRKYAKDFVTVESLKNALENS